MRRIFRFLRRRLLRAPVLVCDEPEEGSKVSRGTVVEGWAYSPVGIREISLWLEGQRVGEAEVGLERPDVMQAHPGWTGALHSGFRYRFDYIPEKVTAASKELVIVAEDERGQRAEVSRVVRPDPGQSLNMRLKSKKQKLQNMRTEAIEPDTAEFAEWKQRKKRRKQEVFQLERELRAVEEGRAEAESQTGALPDFIIIGAKRSGQTTLYNLLTRHPYVEPAASQELHFFDEYFDLDVEWYRQCFPTPRWKEGRETITGEATPAYLHWPYVPERVKKVVPQAQLIALLRNPVHRIYADYRKKERKGRQSQTFEEVIEAEMKWRLRSERIEMLEGAHRVNSGDVWSALFRKGVYVDQLLRWFEFFPKEQILVLKSEDFFERPLDTLKVVLDFLDLPDWEPEASLLQEIRDGAEEVTLHPEIRRRLEEYFEPHNQRLYEYLGRDFGW